MKKIEYTLSSGNVFADANLPNPEELLVKAELVRQITNLIKARGLTQAEAAAILNIDELTVSTLIKGRLLDFPLERLFHFLNKLDQY